MPSSGVAGTLSASPLHVLWAGGEAVLVFFVLSGFVLTLPFLDDARRPRLQSYYPQRFVRLYLPVACAVAFAVLLFVVVDRTVQPGMSWWLPWHVSDLNATAVVKDVTLVDPGSYNSALWSLRHEVLFSILVPLYVLIAKRGSQYAVPLALLALAGGLLTLSIGRLEGLAYCQSIFIIGVLMAVRVRDLERLAGRLSTLQWSCVAIAAWLLVTARWWAPGPDRAAAGAAIVGSALVVFLFLGCPVAIRAGVSPVAGWLGRRSFSLYLVHEPIVVALGFAMPSTNHLLVIVIAVALSLGAAQVFYVLVERPSHRLARRTGQRLRRSRPMEPEVLGA